jgi:hypothetical protein
MEYIYQTKILNKEFCKHVKRKFDNDSRKSDVIDENVKNSTYLRISCLEDWKNENDYLSEKIKEGFSKYLGYLQNEVMLDEHKKPSGIAKDIFKGFNNISFGDFKIQKYEDGCNYKWKHDFYATKDKFRVASFVFYLNSIELKQKCPGNDDDDNDQGVTLFSDEKKIIPERGDVTFFPATWTYYYKNSKFLPHPKYIITGFVFADTQD